MSLDKKILRMKRYCKMLDRYKLNKEETEMPFEDKEDIHTFYEHISFKELKERYSDYFGKLVCEETLYGDKSDNDSHFNELDLTPSRRLRHKIVGHLKANNHKVNSENIELIISSIEDMMDNMFEENAHENIETIIEGLSYRLE